VPPNFCTMRATTGEGTGAVQSGRDRFGRQSIS
jgi:hypothetical protein